MTANRQAIDDRLEALALELPRLRAETRPEDLADAVAGIADEILEDASEADSDHAWTRLQCLLRENDVIPGDEEEPCRE